MSQNQPDLYNLLTDNVDDNDITLQVINKIFDNLDKENISKYHDLQSYNNTLQNNGESMSFLHLNMRSLVKKMNCLNALISSFTYTPDVIALTESWLKPANSKFFNLYGYTAYHLTRTIKSGGGVSLLIKSHLTSELIDDFSFVTDDIEMCTTKLKVRCKDSNSDDTYIVSCIYRPHSKLKNVGKFKNTLTSILSNDTFMRNKVLLLGDFNIDLLSYLAHKPTNQFLSAMQSLNYFELISRPTRFPINNARGRPSLIDHIYCNFHPNCVSGILTNPVADHLPTFVLLPSVKPKVEVTKIQFRLFDTHSRQQFTRALCNISWEELLTRQSVNDNFNLFYETLNNIYNQHFQIKTKVISNKNTLRLGFRVVF